VYKLFEEQTPHHQSMKRFTSQKDIISTKPNKITIRIDIGKNKELKHGHREAKLKTRSIKIFYHGGVCKQELKQK
jgi:hypothetical protein